MTAVLFVILVLLVRLGEYFPSAISETTRDCLIYSLYPIWGVALGKRSRDLGTTFTYGMIIGMIFPIIGVVFLFQPGEKFRKHISEARKTSPPPLPQ